MLERLLQLDDVRNTDRQAISTLVQKCLDSRGQVIGQWEAEINDLVAHLYGLTAAEIAQVSGE